MAALRDLVDIDGLIREHLRTDADWQSLATRAVHHGVDRPLWYALHYCRAWLATAVPEDLPLIAPPAIAVKAMDWIFPRTTLPRLPDRPPDAARRVASHLAAVRYYWLRFPPRLLARHLAHKTLRCLPRFSAVQRDVR